eukprot:Nk52_evm10s307 gene=Nk52_evmTU10s307
MLCELSLWGNFWMTWFCLTGLAFVTLMLFSGSMFYYGYVAVTFEKWQYKSNPKFPAPSMVRMEIIQMLKGMATATMCPAFTLYLSQYGLSQGYCGVEPFGWGYLAFSFLVVWIGSDFLEFLYHRFGHTTRLGWEQHKFHHQFPNPTPFAVIADEYIDQFVRAFPLVLFPLLMPTNMDMMFFIYAVFFYSYGVYLHSGYELPYPDAHHPWINSSFQHYLHHAVSIRNKPYHTGFFFKAWDQLFGSVYTKACFCAKCETAKGERTHEKWLQVVKPDYSVLLKPQFWFNPSESENVPSKAEQSEAKKVDNILSDAVAKED